MEHDKFSTAVKATDVHLHSKEKRLDVTYEDGQVFQLPAEYLRVESPSAEVQGHGAGQKKLVSGRKHVGIMNLEPVGHYALRIVFDDMHDSGIFTWDYLYKLGVEHENRWSAYLLELESAGKSREP